MRSGQCAVWRKGRGILAYGAVLASKGYKGKQSAWQFLHSEDDPLPGGDLLHKQAFQRQSASPAAGPERPSRDAASASSNVTRTGRVIKPPQRLDLWMSSSEFRTSMCKSMTNCIRSLAVSAAIPVYVSYAVSCQSIKSDDCYHMIAAKTSV
ncbi:hypothetical protein NPIL_535501 [Nephila pilipes]|uniref:Uncharacterized protein n=1 Tax=Nephila pilipes TaxID=299642 RepID=A0A8X6QP51_NEPPI|nr:hypothetical protein NPIL_535501 [Nephila pilipes]